MAKNIKTRKDDYAQWYLDVIKAAQLADYSPVKGCMVIRPEGFAIWEAIQRDLDRRFKETGHVNAYFPLLIPQSFLAKEAKHVEGFAMECAIVTHTKLEKDPNKPGQLRPASPLEEPLIIRPTSETIIGHMYSQWIQSYRDLPVLINQWANVMRWEMRTRLFLRTSEFLWQEGHTAHETAEEAQEETLKMLDVYASFMEEILALPVIKGAKTESEKFPGADTTYCVEGLMQDGKALQAGTSHNLGQNFSKAFDIKFLGRDQKQQLCYTTSWGVSTRMIGAMIMAHSDDEGLVLPPKVAPIALAIVPIYKTDEEAEQVRNFINLILLRLMDQADLALGYMRASETRLVSGAMVNKTSGDVGLTVPNGVTDEEINAARNVTGPLKDTGIYRFFFEDFAREQTIIVDWRDARPGDKQYHWEQRGVPFRMEVGPRDVAQGVFVLKNRLNRDKETMQLSAVTQQWLTGKLAAMQATIFDRAKKFRDENTRTAGSYEEMKDILEKQGGFVRVYFEPSVENEVKIKTETKATVRCIPFDQPGTAGKDIITGQETRTQVLFAQSY